MTRSQMIHLPKSLAVLVDPAEKFVNNSQGRQTDSSFRYLGYCRGRYETITLRRPDMTAKR